MPTSSSSNAKFNCFHGMPTYIGMSILIVKMDKVSLFAWVPILTGGCPVGHLGGMPRHPGRVFLGMFLVT